MAGWKELDVFYLMFSKGPTDGRSYRGGCSVAVVLVCPTDGRLVRGDVFYLRFLIYLTDGRSYRAGCSVAVVLNTPNRWLAGNGGFLLSEVLKLSNRWQAV